MEQQERFFKQNINFVRNAYNSFTVFIQTVNVDYDCLVRVIGKTLTLSKHEDTVTNFMTQTKENWDPFVLSRTNF